MEKPVERAGLFYTQRNIAAETSRMNIIQGLLINVWTLVDISFVPWYAPTDCAANYKAVDLVKGHCTLTLLTSSLAASALLLAFAANDWEHWHTAETSATEKGGEC